MRKIILMFSCCLFCCSYYTAAQSFASWTTTELLLNNGLVERAIHLPAADNRNFITTSYKPVAGAFRYFTNSSTDFRFELNHIVYSGKSNWQLQNIEHCTDSLQGNGAAITLLSEDNKVAVTVKFLLYPGLPVIRKNLQIKNLAADTVQLESVDIEKLDVADYGATTFSWICHDYGRRRSIGPYDGNMQDALVTVHNSDWQEGIVIGNEAAGVVKHSSVFWNEASICSGTTHRDARYPFRKYIGKGSSFTTPQVFTIVITIIKTPMKY